MELFFGTSQGTHQGILYENWLLQLNQLTKKDAIPLPWTDDMLHVFGESTFAFQPGYWQVQVKADCFLYSSDTIPMESNAFWIDKRTCKDAIPLAWTSDMLEVLGGGPIVC